MAPLRWGIASTGTISFDFANALSTLPVEDHHIVAVGARNLSSAKDFAKKFDIENFYEGYENLVKDENIGELLMKNYFLFFRKWLLQRLGHLVL
jgi:dihydrodiol dehydrogenase / D-xylose 1-dehydrogenase (NADP)